jgi:hypothetical protein
MIAAMRPRQQPGWTDLNVSDPGITIVELFAFLGEQLLVFSKKVEAEIRKRRFRRRVLGAGVVAAALLVAEARRRRPRYY